MFGLLGKVLKVDVDILLVSLMCSNVKIFLFVRDFIIIRSIVLVNTEVVVDFCRVSW